MHRAMRKAGASTFRNYISEQAFMVVCHVISVKRLLAHKIPLHVEFAYMQRGVSMWLTC